MKTIWKYDLPAIGGSIELPRSAEILTIQTQYGQPKLWALVSMDDQEPPVKRTFKVYGTGHVLPDNPGKYIGTFQMFEGKIVFHLFEEVPT